MFVPMNTGCSYERSSVRIYCCDLSAQSADARSVTRDDVMASGTWHEDRAPRGEMLEGNTSP